MNARALLALRPSWRIEVDPSERTEFVTSGPFRWACTPIFTPMVTAAVGPAMLAPTPLTATSVVMLIAVVGVHVCLVEEPYLRNAMPGWSADAQQVGRLVPRLGRIER